MIPLDKAVVARLESHGEKFEILVDPDLVADIRHGTDIDIEDAVAALFIFENSSKAEKASEENLKKVFDSTDSPYSRAEKADG
jgi:ribosome maturation protein SDO1